MNQELIKTESRNFFFDNMPVRVAMDENEQPWWVAKDVCEILQHSDVSMALRTLDEDEKGTRKICTLGGQQDMLTINESGLYTLIIRSNKPQAKPFRRWITHEVLPAIFRTGGYAVPAVEFTGQDTLVDELAKVIDAKFGFVNDRISKIEAAGQETMRLKDDLLAAKDKIIALYEVKRKYGRRVTDGERARIKALWETGVSKHKISEIMGRPRTTVREVLKMAGVRNLREVR